MNVPIGQVTHYYNRIGVAVLRLSGDLRIGDMVLILGHTTELEQRVTSMEIEHQKVEAVHAGQEVALRVEEPVRKGDVVYKVLE